MTGFQSNRHRGRRRLGLLGVWLLAQASCSPSTSRQEIVLRFIEEPAEELFDLATSGTREVAFSWRSGDPRGADSQSSERRQFESRTAPAEVVPSLGELPFIREVDFEASTVDIIRLAFDLVSAKTLFPSSS